MNPEGSRVEGKQVAGERSKFSFSVTHRWAGLSHAAQKTRQSKRSIYHTSISTGPGEPF